MANLVGTMVYPDGTAFTGTLTLRLNGPAKDGSNNLVMPAYQNFAIGTTGVVDITIGDTDSLTSIDSTQVFYEMILDDDDNPVKIGHLKVGTGTTSLADAWANTFSEPHAGLMAYIPFNNMLNKYPRRAGNDIGTYSNAMAYRTGKLSQGVLISGKQNGTGGDVLTLSRGSQINGNNYSNINSNQGSLTGWWIPRFSPEVQRLGSEAYIFSLVSLGSGVVLAGTNPSGQIYKSTDSGATWSLIQQLGSETNVQSLVSLGGGVVLAGTAETGQIYKSTDSGATWSLIQRLGSETYVYSLVSLGSGVVLAGTTPSGHVYKSTDSGATWSLIQRLGSETEIRSLVSLGGGVVLAGTAGAGQIYKSTDSGATWSLIQQLGGETYVLSLVSLGSGVVLAGTNPSGHVYKSTDSGATWSLIQRLGSETDVRSLVSLGGGVVLAGTASTGQIYKSTDSGATWSLIQQLGSETNVYSLVSLGSGVVLAGTNPSGQIYKSTDSGASFPANIERVLCDFGSSRIYYQGGKFRIAYPPETSRATYAHNITLGTAVFVASTWNVDGAVTTQISANNNTLATEATALTVTAPAATIYIGNDSGNDAPIMGIIDDLAIFDRVLNSTEITSLYNSGNANEAGLESDVNLKSYFKFDGSGNLTSGTNAGLGCTFPWTATLGSNGDFEAGTNKWTSVNCLLEPVTSGTNLLYDGTSLRVNSNAGTIGKAQQEFSVGSAANYFVSVWGKNAAPAPVTFLGMDAIGSSESSFTRYEMAIQATAAITGTVLLTATSAGTAYFDNLWIGTSLLNNGGFEGAWAGGTTPDGWTRVGSCVGTKVVSGMHGGAAHLRVEAGDSSGTYFQNAVTVTNNKWNMFVGYLLAGAGTCNINLSGAATTTLSATQSTWTRKGHVFKATGATLNVRVYANSGGTANFDDLAVIELTDVDITATPATIGSSYDTGKWGTALGALRVDGGDTLTIPGTSANGRNLWWGTGAISLWAYPEGWNGGDSVTRCLFDSAEAATKNRIALLKEGTNLIIRTYSNTAGVYKQIAYPISGTNFAAGTWHHILASWTAGDTSSLWLNGTSVGTESQSGAWANMGTIGQNVYIGSDYAGASQFDGLIDEVRIYDSIPSNANITAIYEDGEYLGQS